MLGMTVASSNKDERRKETLLPPTDNARRGMPPGEVGLFAFAIVSAFTLPLLMIAFRLGVKVKMSTILVALHWKERI
jgi:hypothetical protein